MENQKIIQVEEKVPFKMLLPLSIQHMFAMFGASVLVPFVFGINPAVVLFMNGIGTLLFILITKGKAPAYLGSSFAFLAPAGVVISKWGYEYALGGFVAVGFLGCILALIIYKFGSDWIHVVLPPAAMGPVVALIGLELAGTAASNAGLKDEVIDPKNVIVFLVTLGVAVLGSVVFRKFFAVIPILIAIIRICGRCYLWNCRFLKCEYGVLAGNSEFFCTEIQVGGNRHCAAGSSCDRFRAYRTSDRDE